MGLRRDNPPRPPRDLEALYEIVVALWEENAALRARVEELEEKGRTNSSNSSRPPSSDSERTRKPKRRKGIKRKRGGQPGHEGKTRELLPADQVDDIVECRPAEQCPCGGPMWTEEEHPERHQVFYLPKIKPEAIEYLIYWGMCVECGQFHQGELPEGVPTSMLDPRAMAIIALLSGKYHLSKRNIEEILRDIFSLDPSLGTVSNTERRVSEALEQPVEEAKAFVQQQAVVHADETGHKVAGKRAWMWVAATTFVSVFIIRFSRGAEAAKELLGEKFRGLLVSDRWSAYSWVDAVRRQLCWAHLERDFTKISERGGPSAEVGDAILKYVQRMWHRWHLFKSGDRDRQWLQRRMAPIRRRIEALLAEGTQCGHSKTERTCERILKLKAALWTFVDIPGVEPTNNFAERTIRPYVLWRKASFGTQSQRGTHFVECMMTVTASCKQQRRNVLDYLTAAIHAHVSGRPVPSLLLDQAPADVSLAA